MSDDLTWEQALYLCFQMGRLDGAIHCLNKVLTEQPNWKPEDKELFEQDQAEWLRIHSRTYLDDWFDLFDNTRSLTR